MRSYLQQIQIVPAFLPSVLTQTRFGVREHAVPVV